MNHQIIKIFIFLVFITPADACLCEYGTLDMEQQKFPGVLEVITGKIKHHSKPFYEWRIKDREELERTFKKELAKAEAWRARRAAKEARRIRRGLQVEAPLAEDHEAPRLTQRGWVIYGVRTWLHLRSLPLSASVSATLYTLAWDIRGRQAPR